VRFAWLRVVLVACNGKPAPAPDCPCSRDCPRACRPGEEDRALFRCESLPARCQDLGYLGERREIMNGTASMRFVACAPPVNAGADTLRDGALDA
jgi:hypothetical protein